MVQPDHPPRNLVVSVLRKVYNPIGFQRGYNFFFFFCFAGYAIGIAVARLPYLDFWGTFCSDIGQGDCYVYVNEARYRYGILIHLGTCLPAALLAVLQFLPVIRHKAIMYHRIAGYVAISLILITNGSALAIADKTFGGSVVTQVFVGLLAIMTTTGLFLAVYNVKKLQIDQHRVWMLRTWSILLSIVTIRVLMFIILAVQQYYPLPVYESFSCSHIAAVSAGVDITAKYPECFGTNGTLLTDKRASVIAGIRGDVGNENIQAGLNQYFPAAFAVALFLHIMGVEIYLWLTPKETERLRTVSYQRQMEAGMKNPGSMGLVRDAEPWAPKQVRAPLVRNGSETSAEADTQKVVDNSLKH